MALLSFRHHLLCAWHYARHRTNTVIEIDVVPAFVAHIQSLSVTFEFSDVLKSISNMFSDYYSAFSE